MVSGLKWWRLLGLLAASLAAPAFAADGNPHIVLQSRDTAVDAVAWTPDDKYLLTASGFDHSLTIWDVANRRIVDRAILPADPSAWAGDMLRVEAIEVAPDGRSAVVRGIISDLAKQGTAGIRDYRVDLATRTATVLTGRALPAGTKGLEAYTQWIAAMGAIYESDTAMTEAQATALLPKLPRSHDGKWAVGRAQEGPRLTGAGRAFTLAGPERLGLDDAKLSPDGRVLAALGTASEGAGGQLVTPLVRFNVGTGAFLPPIKLSGRYGLIRWLDTDRLLVTLDADAEDRDSDDGDAKLPISPALIVNATSGAVVRSIPARCYITPIRDEAFLGADPANCRTGMGKGHHLLLNDGTTWKPLVDFEEYAIDAINASTDGKLVAITGALADGTNEIVVLDTVTGKVIDSFSWPKGFQGIITGVQFVESDKALLIAANGGAQLWKFGTTEPSRIIELRTSKPQMIVSNGIAALTSGALDDAVARVSLADGKAMPPVAFARVVAGGFLADKPIFWAVSQTEGLRLWDTRDWRVLLTSIPLEGDHFVSVTPDGRYDTDLGPDADAFRWIVPDAPFQSLPAQTFMRDYFTPRLAQKLLDCTGAGTCAEALPPLPSLTTLNRVLPEVKIVSVEEVNPGFATVRIEARDVTDPGAANGRTRSGIYNVRLFRNGRFAEHQPIEVNEVLHQSLAEWRKLNGWDGGADASGVSQFTMEVPLPTGAGQQRQVFTAYAFNEDRVKSDTARYVYTAALRPVRQPRAYIVTVGIDTYDDTRLQLRFSAADGHLMADRLVAIPGYEVHRLDLTSTGGRRVTRDVVRAAFGLLVGMGDVPEVKAALNGFDTSGIAQVTPDDLVIISWSGHGWANPQGDFFLVPADAKWPVGGAPDAASLVSSADLTMWLRDVRAGEIAVIIDACHSGASVDALAFKPGPMGDPGLGQLAYDKGMRILAATQASDVAIEDARVGQGLLTYALAGEGVTAAGGMADLNKDGRITLDEWLRYAVQRLPSLSADVKLGKLASARGFDLGPQRVETKGQEPALFDFTGAPSPVVLRARVK